MTNIAIDGRPLHSERSGIGRYTYQLTRALLKKNSGHNIFLYGNPFNLICQIHSENELDKYQGRKIPFPFRKVVRILSRLLVQTKRDLHIDVIFWTNFLGEFSSRYKSIITIHDMAHYYYPEHIIPGKGRLLQRYLAKHARRADLILCVSENTKKDVMKILDIPEEKVWVTYNGVGDEFRVINNKDLLREVRHKYKLPERFILFVGTVEPRKNISRLIEAYHILNSHYRIKEPLVMAGGKGWKNEALYQAIRRLRLEDRIIFTGYVNNSDLPLLYNAATLFVYPSLYEGFGLPVAEAMACGTPVVTSNISSLPEVAGDAALLVNPEDAEAIATAVYRLLTDEDLCCKLRELGLQRVKRFTWESCAQKTLEAISYTMRCS